MQNQTIESSDSRKRECQVENILKPKKLNYAGSKSDIFDFKAENPRHDSKTSVVYKGRSSLPVFTTKRKILNNIVETESSSISSSELLNDSNALNHISDNLYQKMSPRSLNKLILEKKEILRKLKLMKKFKDNNEKQRLVQLIDTWRDVCYQVLEDLRDIYAKSEPISSSKILKMFNIDQNLLSIED